MGIENPFRLVGRIVLYIFIYVLCELIAPPLFMRFVDNPLLAEMLGLITSSTLVILLFHSLEMADLSAKPLRQHPIRLPLISILLAISILLPEEFIIGLLDNSEPIEGFESIPRQLMPHAAIIVTMLLATAAAEEVMLRGGVQTALSNEISSPATVVVLSTLAAIVAEGTVYNIISSVTTALINSIIFQRSRSLLPCILTKFLSMSISLFFLLNFRLTSLSDHFVFRENPTLLHIAIAVSFVLLGVGIYLLPRNKQA